MLIFGFILLTNGPCFTKATTVCVGGNLFNIQFIVCLIALAFFSLQSVLQEMSV